MTLEETMWVNAFILCVCATCVRARLLRLCMRIVGEATCVSGDLVILHVYFVHSSMSIYVAQ
jgi:hypothetical protein